ncbi:MAG: CAP domain-containing protein, partial [Planctomycetota bacterium]|nr:CAP domain-containing protein [Planctomycetota bacterium]
AIISLVTGLGTKAAGEKKPRRKLSTGTWTVDAADAKGVTLTSKRKGSSVHPWGALPEKDVLVLLAPARPTPPQRHAMAVLAANMGARDAFVDALLPLYEKGSVEGETHTLVARHLYGLPAAPRGGYSAYKGEILDAQGVHRRKQQERIAFLQSETGRILDLVQKEAGFKKLAKLAAMRDELDKRRRHALTAIFNTVHYPYPVAKDARYWAVQGEIDTRVKHAREIWDNPFSVTLKRDGKLGKHLEAWDAVIEELQIKKIDTTDIQKAMQPYARYVTGEPLTIRTYFRDKAEKELLAYNHWVMTQYNPARTEEARGSERRQVLVTNEYRMLIGYTAVVTPGSAPYASLTKENAVTVLNQAVLEKTMPLRALRIDNRLVKAARLHSEDMSKRGYFAHQAPPNPATGEGATGPANRMQKQGYQGFGYSENIAMSASPDQAHQMWIHSSGHHRNILSGWTELGSGVGGRNFTQNFGTGGGGSPEIQPDTDIRERPARGRGGMGRQPGR